MNALIWTEPRFERTVICTMKVRRIAIHLLTICTLLVQGTAIAWSSPVAAKMMASDSATMTHCYMTQGDDQTQDRHCCCADQCDCLAMCGAGTGVVSEFDGAQLPTASVDQLPEPMTALLTVALPVLLHPPIA